MDRGDTEQTQTHAHTHLYIRVQKCACLFARDNQIYHGTREMATLCCPWDNLAGYNIQPGKSQKSRFYISAGQVDNLMKF